ncbi:MAG TPA: family 16 glycosylhydrolase [Pilimelia sp.]|nr:family 16 glycosylhydrolase [Pilimelia sp.]
MLRRDTSTAGVARRIRRLLLAVLAATAGAMAASAGAPATPAVPARVPAPAGTTGAPAPVWKPILRADFDSATLPAGCTQAGGPSGVQAASWYDPEQVRAGDGYLRLGIALKPNGARPLATGGMDCVGLARTYGRFEIRAKLPPGGGIESVFTLWPEDGGEAESSRFTLAAPDAAAAQVSNAQGGGVVERKAVAGRYADDFHTYTVEWLPAGTRFLVDGRTIVMGTRAYARNRWLGIGVSGGGALAEWPDIGASTPHALLVDWFAISAYAPAGAPSTAAPVPPGPRPTPAPLSRSVVAAAADATPPADPSPVPGRAGAARGLPTSVLVGAAAIAVLLLGLAGVFVREGLRAASGWHRCARVRRHRRPTPHRRPPR